MDDKTPDPYLPKMDREAHHASREKGYDLVRPFVGLNSATDIHRRRLYFDPRLIAKIGQRLIAKRHCTMCRRSMFASSMAHRCIRPYPNVHIDTGLPRKNIANSKRIARRPCRAQKIRGIPGDDRATAFDAIQEARANSTRRLPCHSPPTSRRSSCRRRRPRSAAAELGSIYRLKKKSQKGLETDRTFGVKEAI